LIEGKFFLSRSSGIPKQRRHLIAVLLVLFCKQRSSNKCWVQRPEDY